MNLTFLMFLETFPVSRDKAFGVHGLNFSVKRGRRQGPGETYVYPAASLVFTHTKQLEKRHQLLCDANASRTSAKEQDTMICEWFARRCTGKFRRIDKARENDCAWGYQGSISILDVPGKKRRIHTCALDLESVDEQAGETNFT